MKFRKVVLHQILLVYYFYECHIIILWKLRSSFRLCKFKTHDQHTHCIQFSLHIRLDVGPSQYPNVSCFWPYLSIYSPHKYTKNSLKLLEEKASRVLHLRNSISTKLSEINFIICFRPLFINFIIIFRRSILWRQLFRGRLREKAEIVIRRVTSQNCPTFGPTKNIRSIKCTPKIGSS